MLSCQFWGSLPEFVLFEIFADVGGWLFVAGAVFGVWRGECNEFVTFLWLSLCSRMYFWWHVQYLLNFIYVVQVYKIVAGTDGGLSGMVLPSLLLCGMHWDRVFSWACLFACVPLFFAFHGLLCFVDFVAGAIFLERFLSLDLSWKMTFFRCHRSTGID